jgi:hypothetical protein
LDVKELKIMSPKLKLLLILILFLPSFCFKQNKIQNQKVHQVLEKVADEFFRKRNIFTIDVFSCGKLDYENNLLIGKYMKVLKYKYAVTGDL